MTDYKPMHKVTIIDVPDIGYRTWVMFRNFDLDDYESVRELERRYPYDERNEHIGY